MNIRDRQAAERELEALKGELSALEPTQMRAERLSTVEPTTSRGKVALFRSLFCGREDVYPTQWKNAKTGRTGYAPGLLVATD